MQLFNQSQPVQEPLGGNRFHQLNVTYPLLADIKDKAWLDVIGHARQLDAPPDTTLFSGATNCNNFMLVLNGSIRIYQSAEDGREITLYRVKAGDICILSLNSLLKNKSFNATAITELDVTALVISSESFNAMMGEVEPFRNYVISTLTERLCETICLVQDAVFNHLNMRLACLLGSLFEKNQGLTIKTTHQELAFELGTTREVISRILKEFERQKCVTLSRGQIALASAEGLRWFSQPE